MGRLRTGISLALSVMQVSMHGHPYEVPGPGKVPTKG